MPKMEFTEVALTTGTGTQDITITSFGTVDGAIIFASWASTLDTDTADQVIAVGMTDFTTDRSVSTNNEDNVSPSDASRQLTSDFLRITQAGTNITDRSITTVAAITDGIRITPGQAGTAFRLKVILIQDANISVEQIVPNGTVDTATTITPSFATRLIIAASVQTSTSNTQHNFSYGFCHLDSPSFEQRCASYRMRELTAQETSGRITNNRLIANVNNSGSYSAGFASYEVTAVDSTTWDLTSREVGSSNNFIAMSLGMSGVDLEVFEFDLPNSAGSDWTPTLSPSITFTPDFVHCVLTKYDAFNTSNSNTSDAGPLSICTFDGTNITSVLWASEQGANPTNAESRMSTAMYLQRDTSAVHYNLNTITLQTGGWTVANANITAASSETDRAIGFAIAQPVTGGGMLAKVLNQGQING